MENLFQFGAVDIRKQVSAAFDSVNLINRLLNEDLTENKKKTIERNVRHLELMMTKEKFVEALTEQENTQITTCITAGLAVI